MFSDGADISELEEAPTEGWESLPTVALVEIFKNLQSRKDRLSAAGVCKTWRPPAFQLPLSPEQGLTLDLTRRCDLEKAVFLRDNFICKAPHIQLTFDLEIDAERRNFLIASLGCLSGNVGLKSLKVSLAKGRGHGEEFSGGFLLKLVKAFVQVLKGKALLTTISFPLIGRCGSECENVLFLGLKESRSKYCLQSLFLPRYSFKDKLHILRCQQLQVQIASSSSLTAGLPSLCRLQFLTLSHDSLNDSLLSLLGGGGNVSGGLKRLSLLADRRNGELSNAGWTTFVGNNPLCTVHLTVFGGSGLLAHSSNLIFPALPLAQFRAVHSRDMKVNFLNALVGWNLTSLEHLELVDYDCCWDEALMQMDPEENQFLDPIVYAAWRCKQLHTIKLGIRYCGDSLVGIARLKGPSLLHLEIPKSCVTCKSLNIRTLIREVTKALGRPWKPVDNARSRNMRKLRNSSLSTSPWLELLQADEV